MKYYRQEIQFTPLTLEEETALFERWKNKNDLEARDKIIESHLRLALAEGLKAGRGRLPEDDIVSAANFGLMKAINKFCPVKAKSKKARFAAFATKFIRGEVQELFRFNGPAQVSIDHALGRDQSSNPRINFADGTPTARERSTLNPVSAAIPVTEDNPASIFEDEDFRRVWVEKAHVAMSKLPTSHRILIRQVLIEGRTLAEVGKLQSPPVSRAAVRTRYQRALARLQNIVKELCRR